MDAPAVIVCGDKLEWCHCTLSTGHDGPHECNPQKCGGMWTYDASGETVVVKLPDFGRSWNAKRQLA
jgi:hypothetical protein